MEDVEDMTNLVCCFKSALKAVDCLGDTVIAFVMTPKNVRADPSVARKDNVWRVKKGLR